jgi:lipoprotein-anchoring transpeptidase ErfK/SrfK
MNPEKTMRAKMPFRYIPVVLAALATGALAGAPAVYAEPATPRAAWEPGEAAVQIEVSLSDRALHVRRGGEVIASYDVAIGKSKHPTPTGTFHIRRIIWNPSWTPPNSEWARGRKPKRPGEPGNPMGRVKIFFAEPDYFIHGTEDEESIGRAASHGCIRMRNEDAIALARLVMEQAGDARPPAWYRRVLNRVTRTEEVRLPRPIPIRIQQRMAAGE